MKKSIALLFFFIFLMANVSQFCKIYFAEDVAIENVMDNEKDVEKKSVEDSEDFLKEKIIYSQDNSLSIFSISAKQYLEHIFQYKNPHHEVDINPPELITVA
jgi:hypothetical protein